ncbi:hypothetical protein PFISCL1PPCAC_29051 [Pristionchus fissidentatus]|uniref:C2H2-type domain-containing protein n=1 Tax=Pristionchus fissidentatus TaxID=1538716 RepID=A0AAV5X390_9BILA|nr:hypothetical protein PFISCL1PPCAC_29051 [Pristionchus fissidentatus]
MRGLQSETLECALESLLSEASIANKYDSQRESSLRQMIYALTDSLHFTLNSLVVRKRREEEEREMERRMEEEGKREQQLLLIPKQEPVDLCDPIVPSPLPSDYSWSPGYSGRPRREMDPTPSEPKAPEPSEPSDLARPRDEEDSDMPILSVCSPVHEEKEKGEEDEQSMEERDDEQAAPSSSAVSSAGDAHSSHESPERKEEIAVTPCAVITTQHRRGRTTLTPATAIVTRAIKSGVRDVSLSNGRVKKSARKSTTVTNRNQSTTVTNRNQSTTVTTPRFADGKTMQCPLCETSGLSLFLLQSHLTYKHKTTPTRQNIGMKCECGKISGCYQTAYYHTKKCSASGEYTMVSLNQ